MGCYFLIGSGFAATLDGVDRLIAQGKHVDAVLELEEWTRKYPRDFKAQFLLGKEYARSNRFDKAIETFQLVSGLRPELPEPHANLAAIFNVLGRLESAVRELNLYLERDPDASIAHVNLADLYVKLALQHYKKVLEQHKNLVLQAKFNSLKQILHETPRNAKDVGLGKND